MDYKWINNIDSAYPMLENQYKRYRNYLNKLTQQGKNIFYRSEVGKIIAVATNESERSKSEIMNIKNLESQKILTVLKVYLNIATITLARLARKCRTKLENRNNNVHSNIRVIRGFSL